MTVFRVSHLSSACLLVSTSDCNILCDPVSRNPHYDGWLLYPHISTSNFESIPLDFIFISHIHEDHYDPNFIHEIFNHQLINFGRIPKLIIAKRPNANYLAKKMGFDGFQPLVCDSITFSNTHLKLLHYSTGSELDLDSVLCVQHNGHSLLNSNDIIYDEKSISNLTVDLPLPISLLATSYAGAGPFPHCYFDNDQLQQEHIKKVQYNKSKLLNMISIFKPKIVLPFAGEHFLTGPSFNLNPYRGHYDRFETVDLDSRCKPLDVFKSNYIDLFSGDICGLLTSPENLSDNYRHYSEIALSLDSCSSIISSDITSLQHDLSTASTSFVDRISKLASAPSPYSFIFLDASSSEFIYELTINCDSTPEDYSEIRINPFLLHDIVLRHKHWDNIFGGSLIRVNRHGSSYAGYSSEPLLSFFHI